VFGGDFRQILPVIPRGNRSDIVHASINSSYIWDECHVLTLTKNMRLRSNAGSSDADELKTFSEWILKVGEGKISEPNDGIADFEIPDDMLIKEFDDPIDAIMKSTYPNFLNMYNNLDYLQQRAILASTIDVVDTINDYVLSIIPSIHNHHYSLTL
jgi:ATP-dependent DNA helicase PIF1